MHYSIPRFIISALRGGSGKTILSLGMASLWERQGIRVAPFKKGPDFIDSGWLSFAAGRPCHNVDPFMMNSSQILQSVRRHSISADIALIEGNRGLFDGLDPEGHYSTASLGRLLKAPVILIVDVTMATRTVAALVMGCQRFDEDLAIEGVILNRVATPRQEGLVRSTIERYCGLPVLGAVPRLESGLFPERHMGLVPRRESVDSEKALAWARDAVSRYIDVEALRRIANEAPPFEQGPGAFEQTEAAGLTPESPRIGYIRDDAFWFYYPENLEQLRERGANLVELNAMRTTQLPELDALYIGGGFPETQAAALAANEAFRNSLKRAIDEGLPVYAECGGLMYMGKELLLDENAYPMTGVLPVSFVLEPKPQGHGYTILNVSRQNPYYPVGTILRGHEFHYSRPVMHSSVDIVFSFDVERGRGFEGKRDGLCKKNLLATYTHLHAGGTPGWAESLYHAAQQWRTEKKLELL
jgi:cobyrinic acid a,c-diamide synthase